MRGEGPVGIQGKRGKKGDVRKQEKTRKGGEVPAKTKLISEPGKQGRNNMEEGKKNIRQTAGGGEPINGSKWGEKPFMRHTVTGPCLRKSV